MARDRRDRSAVADIIDFFKDLVGIIDDAEDVRHRTQEILQNTQAKAKRIQDRGSKFADRIQRASNTDDPKAIIAIIDIVDGEVPVLFSDTSNLENDFQEARRELNALRAKIRRDFPNREVRRSTQIVQKALFELNRALKANAGAIKAYSKVQRTFNSRLRSKRKFLLGAGALDLIATGGIATALTAIVIGANEGRTLTTIATVALSPAIAALKVLQVVFGTIGGALSRAVRGSNEVVIEVGRALGAPTGVRSRRR